MAIISSSLGIGYLIVFLLMSSLGQTAEVSAVISRAHDGKFEVRPSFHVNPDYPELFGLVLFDTVYQKNIGELPGLYDIYHGTDWISSWHRRLAIVAIQVGDSRRYSHVEIFCVRDGKLHSVPVPEYMMNVLGRVNATATFNVGISRLTGWDGNDLRIRVEFDVSAQERHQFAGSFRCTVVLRLENPEDYPFVKLYDVSELEKDG